MPDLENDADIVMISELSYFQKYVNLLEKEKIFYLSGKNGHRNLGQIKNDHIILIGDSEESEKISL